MHVQILLNNTFLLKGSLKCLLYLQKGNKKSIRKILKFKFIFGVTLRGIVSDFREHQLFDIYEILTHFSIHSEEHIFIFLLNPSKINDILPILIPTCTLYLNYSTLSYIYLETPKQFGCAPVLYHMKKRFIIVTYRR